MQKQTRIVVMGLVLVLGLSGCGGDGRLASTPTPPTSAPPPPPVNPNPPPNPEGPIGLVSDEPFAVLGVGFDYVVGDTTTVTEPQRVDIALSYRSDDDTYVISLPGYNQGALRTRGYSGSYNDSSAWTSINDTYNELLDGDSGRQDAVVSLSYPSGPLNTANTLSYTSWGNWGDDPQFMGNASSGSFGNFAYGIPTKAGDVPVTGTATYSAQLIGQTNQSLSGTQLYVDYIGGTAQLRFDFGAGTLAGEMAPFICPWDCYSLGTYTFANTVYATGSTQFSGEFALDGVLLPSWFEGSFNGPQAQEMMARWQAPYEFEGVSGVMGGIWVGAKD